jgi:hypothetical protein
MSSKRHIRRKSCEGKVRYATVEEARKRLRGGMNAYRCKFCGGYHIGHRPGTTAKVLNSLAGRHKS